MNIIGEECGARHFKGERPSDKTFTQCCRKGKVVLPPPKECPAPLAQIMQNNHPKAKSFMRKIRTYNNAHAFASMRATISSPPGRGPYCFRIHGQIYRNTTPMDKNTDNPKYADLYFMDSSQAPEYRDHSEVKTGCYRDLMEEIDAMLRRLNPYAAVYKMMRQVLEEEYRREQAENLPHRTLGIIISSDRKNLDKRRYNNPTTNEIPVLFKSSNGEPPAERDLILLEDDRVWENTMTEAATYQIPHELRQLFVDICLYFNPADPLRLLESNMNHLMEDYIRRGHK